MNWTRCFIGLGSNLPGDHDGPDGQLRLALQSLQSDAHVQLGKVSSFYRSVAIGPGEQPDYCNAVAEIHTDCGSLQLLNTLQAMEARQGRDRTSALRWGPRTLDLDILLYGDAIINKPRLTVPHPHMAGRAFVLVPLAEIAPDLEIPGGGRVDELARAVQIEGLELWER